MYGKVLVLNQDYQAISICSVERALTLVFLNKAEVISVCADKCIHTVNTTYPFPSIIRLLRYIIMPYKKVVLSRQNIFKRDNNMCQYCGSRQDLTIDHVIPRSRGGVDSWENCVAACRKCNHKKGDLFLGETSMKLLRRPFKPNYLMFLREFTTIHEDWKPYLYVN